MFMILVRYKSCQLWSVIAVAGSYDEAVKSAELYVQNSCAQVSHYQIVELKVANAPVTE